MENGPNGKSRSHGEVGEWRVKGEIVGLCITSCCEHDIGRWVSSGCTLVASANEAWAIRGSEAQAICSGLSDEGREKRWTKRDRDKIDKIAL
jgi:hypothetical protein